MNKEDTAWLAGFFEGEGCVSLVQNKYIYIRISQKETSILRKIQKLLGFGQVYSFYRDDFRGSCWVCSSKYSKQFISLIYPYMKSNRKIAQINRVLNSKIG